MSSRHAIACVFCTRWVALLGTPDEAAASAENRQICEAFPEGIPDPIWNMTADHRLAFTGDQGLRWESQDGADYPEWALIRDDADAA